MERQGILREARDMLGVVPEFLQRVPESHLAPLWASMRDLQLLPGKIPASYQQLVMLAASTSAKCKYCIELHTQTARALGVTEDEIIETALLTGHTANLSNYLGGTQYDLDQFKREVRAACDALAGNGGIVGVRSAAAQRRLP
jgi:AhpD family alkylhydroperoxidase